MKTPRSRLAALFLLICCFAVPAPMAVAQDDESLPDPNEEQQREDDNGGGNGGGSDLPETGLPALLLAAGGALLLSSGAVIRPARRIKRRYEHGEWLARVNPERYGRPSWEQAVRDRRRRNGR